MMNKKKMTIEDLAAATKIDINDAIGKLAIIVQKGFTETARQIDLFALTERVSALEKDLKGMHSNFDIVFQQLKEIRQDIKEADSRADVFDLQIRMTKLEKKVKG